MPATGDPGRRSGRRKARRERPCLAAACAVLIVGGFPAALALPGSLLPPPAPAESDPTPTLSAVAPSYRTAEPPAPGTRSRTGPSGSPVRPARPVRFDAARLGVAVTVVPVDAAGGTLAPPADPLRLGWWREGAWPGAGKGRVLLTGHTVHTGGGALDHLERLERGDAIRVATDRGAREYRVRSTRYLTVAEFAQRAERLLRRDGPERLVVVTCENWDGDGYEGSVVVVAAPVRR